MNKLTWIADASSNHSGSLEKAYKLIEMASYIGIDIIKFQHWVTERFINQERFEKLKISHQKSWNKSVYEVYKEYEIPLDWISKLKKCADDNNIEFLISEYDLQSVEYTNQFVDRWKVGSGDINYFNIIQKFIDTNKQIMFGLGCCSYQDWLDLMDFLANNNYLGKSVFLQCNTNYKLNENNRKYINLNLLDYLKKWGCKFGISDHLKDNKIILGAIAKGAIFIERHFKLDENNNSPDNKFSLAPYEFIRMMDVGNELFECLGDGKFKIEKNELETRKIQRRSKNDWKRPDLEYKGN